MAERDGHIADTGQTELAVSILCDVCVNRGVCPLPQGPPPLQRSVSERFGAPLQRPAPSLGTIVGGGVRTWTQTHAYTSANVT
jgi:hypothetical protein